MLPKRSKRLREMLAGIRYVDLADGFNVSARAYMPGFIWFIFVAHFIAYTPLFNGNVWIIAAISTIILFLLFSQCRISIELRGTALILEKRILGLPYKSLHVKPALIRFTPCIGDDELLHLSSRGDGSATFACHDDWGTNETDVSLAWKDITVSIDTHASARFFEAVHTAFKRYLDERHTVGAP